MSTNKQQPNKTNKAHRDANHEGWNARMRNKATIAAGMTLQPWDTENPKTPGTPEHKAYALGLAGKNID
jgi:hypothetical protein